MDMRSHDDVYLEVSLALLSTSVGCVSAGDVPSVMDVLLEGRGNSGGLYRVTSSPTTSPPPCAQRCSAAMQVDDDNIRVV